MTNNALQLISRLAALVAALSITPVFAQSEDECLRAAGQTAIDLCSKIIDRGRGTENVYFKLASGIYQTGDFEKAMSLIDAGLARFPGGRKLTNLKQTLLSDDEEKKELVKSASKNEDAMSRAQLKITCLTDNSRKGLNACKGYLAQTNIDAGRINTRLAELARLNASTAVASREPETASPTPRTQPRPTTPAPSEDQLARKQTIKEIQSILNILGFQAGTADGIAGSKTRTALNQLQQSIRTPLGSNLDDGLLTELESLYQDKLAAENLLRQSQQSLNSDDPETALSRLNLAQNLSPLLAVAAGYRQQIDNALARKLAINTTPQPQPQQPEVKKEPVPVEQPRVEQPANTPQPAAELDTVLAQIDTLTAKLRLRQGAQSRHNSEVRRVLRSTFPGN